MKKLQFHAAFGNFHPGDVIEVEDDAIYDQSYLREAPEDAEVKDVPAPAAPAAAPLYPPKDA